MIRFAKRMATKVVPQRSLSGILATFAQVDADLAALIERHDNKVQGHLEEIRRLDHEIDTLGKERSHAGRVRQQLFGLLPPPPPTSLPLD